MKHRFPNIRNKIVNVMAEPIRAKLDSTFQTSEVQQAVSDLGQAQKKAVELNEEWECSICHKLIPSAKYSKHYFKCFSRSLISK